MAAVVLHALESHGRRSLFQRHPAGGGAGYLGRQPRGPRARGRLDSRPGRHLARRSGSGRRRVSPHTPGHPCSPSGGYQREQPLLARRLRRGRSLAGRAHASLLRVCMDAVFRRNLRDVPAKDGRLGCQVPGSRQGARALPRREVGARGPPVTRSSSLFAADGNRGSERTSRREPPCVTTGPRSSRTAGAF